MRDTPAAIDDRASAVEPNRLDDLAQVVGHGHRSIGERGAAHATTPQDLVELVLIGRVVGHRGRGIFELMASQNADDAIDRRR